MTETTCDPVNFTLMYCGLVVIDLLTFSPLKVYRFVSCSLLVYTTSEVVAFVYIYTNCAK